VAGADSGRDARARGDGALPLGPFRPDECQFTPLDSAELCRGVEPCSVTFAGDLSCARRVRDHDVVLTAEHVFARIGLADGVDTGHVVARFDLALQGAELAWPVRAATAQLHALPNSGIALLAYETGKASVQRLRQFPDDWGDLSETNIQGEPMTAAFDAQGRAHVFSLDKTSDGQAAVYRSVLPGAPEKVLSTVAPYARALPLLDGTTALFYQQGAYAAPRVMRWTEREGSVELLAFPPPAANLPPPSSGYAPADALWAALPLDAGQTRLVYAHEQQLVSDADPSVALLRWAAPLPDCTATRRVLAPDICPQERTREPAGEQLRSIVLARGKAGPVILALLAKTTRVCSWSGSCSESLPCDCYRHPRHEVDALTLLVQPLANPARSFRLPLPGAKSAVIKWSGDLAGMLVVAVNLDPGTSLPSRTLFLRLDTR
jgi:hypothetical protein